MSESLARKYSIPPSLFWNPYDWFDRGGIPHLGEEWAELPCSPFPLAPPPPMASSRRIASVREARGGCVWPLHRLFSPRASMWADAGVGALARRSAVCLCLQLPLLSTVRGEVMASCSFFLAASPSGAEPAPLGCALQRWSRSPVTSVENADIRTNACCAAPLLWAATCFSTITSSLVLSPLLQCSQVDSFPKTFFL